MEPIVTVVDPRAPARPGWRAAVRRTLLSLLVLVAVPLGACRAQTAPPPLDERSLDQVSPTVAKRLARRFSLGAFAGRFEATPLAAVRQAVGQGTVRHQGDAGESLYWLCYRSAGQRLWIVSGGELGGADHRVTDIVAERADQDTAALPGCAELPAAFAPLEIDGRLRLGMPRPDVVTALGPPSGSDGDQMVYRHEARRKDGFEESAWLILRFRDDRLVSLRGHKTTTN
jgi:hypothetical protein